MNVIYIITIVTFIFSLIFKITIKSIVIVKHVKRHLSSFTTPI